MVRKYALYRIAHWLRENREQLSKLPLDEVKHRMVKEGLDEGPSYRSATPNRSSIGR